MVCTAWVILALLVKRLKQQKLDLGSGRTSCKLFLANQMRLLFSSLAYVLIHALQAMTLKKIKLKNAYVRTLREKLFKVEAVITINTRRIKLMLDSRYPLQDLFIKSPPGSLQYNPKRCLRRLHKMGIEGSVFKIRVKAEK